MARHVAVLGGARQLPRSRSALRSAMPAAAPNPYLAFVRRWWWLLVLGAVLGTLGAFAYLRFGPVPYESTANVLVPPQSNPGANSLGSPGQVQGVASNYAVQASSSRVYEAVSRALQGLSARKLSAKDLLTMDQENQINVGTQRGSNLIAISVTDSDPAFASLLANTIASVFVKDVQDRAAADLDNQKQELEQKIETTRQQFVNAQLFQRQQDLLSQLRDQRSQLLQIQMQYQQELQRQVEEDQRAQVVVAGSPKPTPEQLQRAQLLAEASARVRTQWLQIVGAQQKDVEQNITTLNAQLAAVNDGLSRVPDSTDTSVEAAFATAYGAQLQSLTAEYVHLQLNGQASASPVQLYGEASPPVTQASGKKTLPIGAGLGIALATALAYALEWLQRQRAANRGGLLSGFYRVHDDLEAVQPAKVAVYSHTGVGGRSRNGQGAMPGPGDRSADFHHDAGSGVDWRSFARIELAPSSVIRERQSGVFPWNDDAVEEE